MRRLAAGVGGGIPSAAAPIRNPRSRIRNGLAVPWSASGGPSRISRRVTPLLWESRDASLLGADGAWRAGYSALMPRIARSVFPGVPHHVT